MVKNVQFAMLELMNMAFVLADLAEIKFSY